MANDRDMPDFPDQEEASGKSFETIFTVVVSSNKPINVYEGYAFDRRSTPVTWDLPDLVYSIAKGEVAATLSQGPTIQRLTHGGFSFKELERRILAMCDEIEGLGIAIRPFAPGTPFTSVDGYWRLHKNVNKKADLVMGLTAAAALGQPSRYKYRGVLHNYSLDYAGAFRLGLSVMEMTALEAGFQAWPEYTSEMSKLGRKIGILAVGVEVPSK
jgi:hypothetical protein